METLLMKEVQILIAFKNQFKNQDPMKVDKYILLDMIMFLDDEMQKHKAPNTGWVRDLNNTLNKRLEEIWTT